MLRCDDCDDAFPSANKETRLCERCHSEEMHRQNPGFLWDDEYPEDDRLDGGMEPVGSCEWCDTNLYPGDDPESCDQCLWYSTQS